MKDWRYPRRCEDCRSGRIAQWDADRECRPVCWMRRDGGWAARTWEWWVQMSEQSETSGVWRVCWPAFTALVPRAVLEDDEARLELAEAFQLCAAVLNRPTDRMLPDTDEDD